MSTDPDPGGFPDGGLPDEDAPRRRHPVFLAGVLVLIAAVAGVGGYLYSRLSGSEPPGEVPLVRAEPGPTKKRPDEPGGMTIPNQDKLVYQAITEGADGKGEKKVERLLPPPEEPLPPPEPPAPPAAAASPVPPPPAGPQKAAPAPAAQPAQTTPKTTTKTPAKTTAKKTSPPPAPAKTASSVASKATAKAPAGAYLVQIAAFRSRAKADAAWTRLAKAHRDLLGKLKPLVRKVDLGAEKGVYYRLRAGPLRNAAEARALCAKLKARKLDCLVVRP